MNAFYSVGKQFNPYCREFLYLSLDCSMSSWYAEDTDKFIFEDENNFVL